MFFHLGSRQSIRLRGNEIYDFLNGSIWAKSVIMESID